MAPERSSDAGDLREAVIEFVDRVTSDPEFSERVVEALRDVATGDGDLMPIMEMIKRSPEELAMMTTPSGGIGPLADNEQMVAVTTVMTAAATTPATTTTTTLLNWDACRQLHLQKTMTPDKTVTTVLCDVLFNCGPQPLA